MPSPSWTTQNSYHEAGHTGALLALPGTTTPRFLVTQPGGGFSGQLVRPEANPYRTAGLVPSNRDGSVVELWHWVIVALAGPLAELRYRGLPLTRREIRDQWGSDWDWADARKMCAHGWPEDSKEALRRALAGAVEIIGRPDVWAGIGALARHLIEHGRADAATIEVLVRRHLPQPLPEAPGVRWALTHARIDPARAKAAMDEWEAEHDRRVKVSGIDTSPHGR